MKYSQISAQFKNVFAARIVAPLSPYFDPIVSQVSPCSAVYVLTQVGLGDVELELDV